MNDFIDDPKMNIAEEELKQSALEILEMSKTQGWKRVEKLLTDNIAFIDDILRGNSPDNKISDLNDLKRFQDQREHLQSLLNLPAKFAEYLKEPEQENHDPYD